MKMMNLRNAIKYMFAICICAVIIVSCCFTAAVADTAVSEPWGIDSSIEQDSGESDTQWVSADNLSLFSFGEKFVESLDLLDAQLIVCGSTVLVLLSCMLLVLKKFKRRY